MPKVLVAVIVAFIVQVSAMSAEARPTGRTKPERPTQSPGVQRTGPRARKAPVVAVLASAEDILKSSNLDQQDVATIVADLEAIAKEMQSQGNR